MTSISLQALKSIISVAGGKQVEKLFSAGKVLKTNLFRHRFAYNQQRPQLKCMNFQSLRIGSHPLLLLAVSAKILIPLWLSDSLSLSLASDDDKCAVKIVLWMIMRLGAVNSGREKFWNLKRILWNFISDQTVCPQVVRIFSNVSLIIRLICHVILISF